MKEKLSYLINTHEGGVKKRFASKVGLSTGQLNDYLTGRCRPKDKIQGRIASAYGVTREWLMQDSKDVNTSGTENAAIWYEDVRPKNDYEKIIWLVAEIKRAEKDMEIFADRIGRALVDTERVLLSFRGKT